MVPVDGTVPRVVSSTSHPNAVVVSSIAVKDGEDVMLAVDERVTYMTTDGGERKRNANRKRDN